MIQRKKRPKLVLKKSRKDYAKTLEELKRRSLKTEKYIREPWMTRSNPPADKYEEFLQKEAESF